MQTTSPKTKPAEGTQSANNQWFSVIDAETGAFIRSTKNPSFYLPSAGLLFMRDNFPCMDRVETFYDCALNVVKTLRRSVR